MFVQSFTYSDIDWCIGCEQSLHLQIYMLLFIIVSQLYTTFLLPRIPNLIEFIIEKYDLSSNASQSYTKVFILSGIKVRAFFEKNII